MHGIILGEKSRIYVYDDVFLIIPILEKKKLLPATEINHYKENGLRKQTKC